MTWWHTFLSSLFKVRARSLIIASLITLSLLASSEAIFRFRLLGLLPLDYLLRDENDDQTHAAWQLANVQSLPQDITPVYIIGGSGMREAIESASAFEDILRKRIPDHRFKVFLLQTSSHNLANDLVLLDLIEDRAGIILYGIDPNRFVMNEKDFKNQAMGVGTMGRNGAYFAFLKEHKIDYIPTNTVLRWILQETYLVQASRLFGEKLLNRSVLPTTFKNHLYSQRDEDEKFNKDIETSRVNLIENKVGSPDALTVQMAKRFFDLALKQGHRILLIEQPMDYNAVAGRLDSQLKRYHHGMVALARTLHLSYIDFVRDLHLPSSVFADRAHIYKSEGRMAFMTKLADEMALWITTTEKQP